MGNEMWLQLCRRLFFFSSAGRVFTGASLTTTQVSSVKETSALISLNKKNMLKTRQTEIKDGCRQSEKHGADAVAPHLSVRMLRASRSARLVHKQSPSRE